MKNKNFLVRVITGICLMAVMVPAIIFGGVFFLVIATLLSIIGTYELMNMFYKKNEKLKNMRFIMPIFSGLITVSLYFAINNGLTILPLLAYVLGVLVAMAFGVFKDGTEASDILSCVMSITYAGLLLSLAFCVEYLPPIVEGEGWLKIVGGLFAYLYSIVVFTDVFAYLFGSKFGKHKLCPTISPKKSVEGAVAGLTLGALVGVGVGLLFGAIPFKSIAGVGNKILVIVAAYVISLIISATVQIGDLVASKLKRTYDIKDYGFIFPGHGGVMDRFDSLIFSGALFFVIMQIIYLFV